MRIVSVLWVIMVASVGLGCGATGKCAEAIERADACGVPDLELEDDLGGCVPKWECRSACVVSAPCGEIKASFGGGTDRTTAAWKCFEACGI